MQESDYSVGLSQEEEEVTGMEPADDAPNKEYFNKKHDEE